jgi:uncharacterized protein YndB with AHSA1/START domain
MSDTAQASGRIGRPPSEVFQAIVDPAKLSAHYTDKARGRMETGSVVHWEFDDYPGEFPVTVIKSEPNRFVSFEWDADAGEQGGHYKTTVEIELEPLDDGKRTLVTIKEIGFLSNEKSQQASYAAVEGWAALIWTLKVYLEHGIRIRTGFFS